MNEKAPVDIAQLRRSTRSTRYDGFRVPQITHAKQVMSKVKPKMTPAITISSKATEPQDSTGLPEDVAPSDELPPPTPIQTIQYGGTNLCGIPATNLSPRKLLSSLHTKEPKLPYSP